MVDGTKNNSIDDDLLKNNIDDNEAEEVESIKDEGFLEELSDLQETIKEVAKDKIQEREVDRIEQEKDKEKSEIQTETLDGLGDLMGEIPENKTKVSEFFEEGKKEFEVVDTLKEKKVIRKHKDMKSKFEGRPEGVKQAIEKSVDNILDEIYNWKEEKNPVARSLLRIVNMIMKTEKKIEK